MSTEKYFTYRGDIRALAGVGDTLAFVTTHPEKQPTAVCRVRAETLAFDEVALPCGGQALLAVEEGLIAAGTDGRLYRLGAKDKQPAPLGPPLPAPATALALAGDRLIALCEKQVVVVARAAGQPLQTLELAHSGTALATDPTGQWLVVGSSQGEVAVYTREERDEFLLSERDKLHEGPVTALLFEPEELRFLSAGADNKLLLTLARGKLEPEDRGRGGAHEAAVTAIIHAPGERFLTGALDKTIKTWPRQGAARPATLKEGVGKVIALALIHIHNRPHVAAACDDNTLRLFLLDAAGKFGDLTHKLHDGYAWAEKELGAGAATPAGGVTDAAMAEMMRRHPDTPIAELARRLKEGPAPSGPTGDAAAREHALRTLAAWRDARSLDLIAAQVGADSDPALRLLAAELLGEARHARAAKALEGALRHADEAVRVAALRGLRAFAGDRDLKPLDLALKTGKADVGVLAIEALAELAKTNDEALARLTQALDANPAEVRLAAILRLESVFASDDPEPNLRGLKSKHADARVLALTRLRQRGLLEAAPAQAALRRHLEDKEAAARRVAFLVSLFTRPNLVLALRARDQELHRQLHEVETTPSHPAAIGGAEGASVDQGAGKGKPGKDKAGADKSAKGKTGKSAGKSKAPGDAAPEAAGAADASLPADALPPRPKFAGQLGPADYEPLLRAAACRALDVCVLGARCLSLLGDPRALGMLLQLSREELPAARVDVCKALAALDDPRAVKRLRTMLHDEAVEARDAAFTALAALRDDAPLEAAEAGLAATHEDIRRRGLQLLVAQLRKSPPKSSRDPARSLLLRALQDSFPAVRAEAFKTALNLQIDGGGAEALRFALGSVHADVRREALTEAMAQANQAWGWRLVLDLLADPDPGVRGEAFAFALDKVKGKSLEPVEQALRAPHADMRLLAVKELAKKHVPEAQTLLAGALPDADRGVRQAALDALVASDAAPALAAGLASPHADVVVGAAAALARHGDGATLAPLLQWATAPKPREAHLIEGWRELAEKALEGLARLGDPAARPRLAPLLETDHEGVRVGAARALAACARPGQVDEPRRALAHPSAAVKHITAAGLALVGDAEAASILFSAEARKHVGERDLLAAACALGPRGEEWFAAFLDHDDFFLRQHALVALLARESLDHDGAPARLPQALAAGLPRARLAAARALECFGDGPATRALLVETLNERPDDTAWQIPAETVDDLAAGLAFGDARLVGLLVRALDALRGEKQTAWDLAWRGFSQRYASELAAARSAARARPAPAPRTTSGELLDLAFGAYVGLAREQAQSRDRKRQTLLAPQMIRVRQSALRRVVALARRDARYAQAAAPVLTQVLGDPAQDVRKLAFEQLLALGVPAVEAAGAALETGHVDLGVEGLKLLAGGDNTDSDNTDGGQRVLRQTMLTRQDDLAQEAARLLGESIGVAAVGAAALEAAHPPMRLLGVSWLLARYDDDPQAKAGLAAAYTSRYRAVRLFAATRAAAEKKDPRAFDALTQLLVDADPAEQTQIANAVRALGDPRGADALLDRVENDPAGNARHEQLLSTAGAFRHPPTAARLLRMADPKAKWTRLALRAALMISGHDQPNDDLDDEDDGPGFTEAAPPRFPRHDAILADVLRRALELGQTDVIDEALGDARLCRGKEVDEVLARLAADVNDDLRREAVEAVGFRLRKRGGPAEPLLKALRHADPLTKTAAACGLARAGRDDGLSTLMTAVEFVDDLDLRAQAVGALGELADPRALDLLLRLATTAGHALGAAATEALGHMGRSEKKDEIFKLLAARAEGTDDVAVAAVLGLTWFNTPEGWKIARRRALDRGWWRREEFLARLGDNDDPATREVLLALLRDEPDGDLVSLAALAARKLFGADALDPDFALLLNPAFHEGEDCFDAALARVAERGRPGQILESLARCHESIRDTLRANLLKRGDLPLAEAAAALAGEHPLPAQVAAQWLGRAGARAAAHAAALEQALAKWRQAWSDEFDALERANREPTNRLREIADCLERLAWACGRAGAAGKALVELATAPPRHGMMLAARLEAATALAESRCDAAGLAALESLALTGDPRVRALASSALARQAPARSAQLVDQMLGDGVSLARATQGAGLAPSAALRAAAEQTHYQGAALPLLVAAGDFEALAAAAGDRQLPETARLGAIEALANLARVDAEAFLARLGAAADEDEDIRKAAWRGRRRSTRARRAVAGSTSAAK